MITSVGTMQAGTPGGARSRRAAFEREGYTVGRSVFAPEVVREIRAPLVAALVADGYVAPVEDDEDRFRWTGDATAVASTLRRSEYEDPLKRSVEELLLSTGAAGKAIEGLWGRRPAIWDYVGLAVSLPGAPPGGRHRDFGQMTGHGEPSNYVRLWCPLTRLGDDDGALGIAVGSHLIPNGPEDAPVRSHVLHKELPVNTRNLPSDEQLAPLWRTTRFDVGDALLFRTDLVHGAAPNRGSCLRLALILNAQDARVPLAGSAGLSLDSIRDLTDVEWLALAILAIQPTCPWHMRCAFYPRGIIGRLWSEQPGERIERTFTTLEARGLIEPHETHFDHEFWLQRYYHATPTGSSKVTKWLTTPSSGDPRLLALKLLLSDWLGLDTTALLADA